MMIIGGPCPSGGLDLGPCASDHTDAIVVTVCVVLAVILSVLALAFRYRVWPMSRLIRRRDRIMAELDARLAARDDNTDLGQHPLGGRRPVGSKDSAPGDRPGG
jgi:hypothetical protein